MKMNYSLSYGFLSTNLKDLAITFYDSSQRNPRVWVLSGFKAGDMTQMLALANGLDWPYEVKQFHYRRSELLTNRLFGATLAGIDKHRSSDLMPPWPDIVITAGRRNEPIAKWIKQQHSKARLVHLGRPWSSVSCFDLVVTTPQYFVPAADNVLQISLPLHEIGPEKLTAWRKQWEAKFAGLPRPIWSLMLGGDSGPFVFNSEKSIRLAQWLNETLQCSGGSVLVTNSARTDSAAYQAFLKTIRVPYMSYHWSASGQDNPYRGYLACADSLVVTGESMSMLAEAVAVQKPLYIFDLADCPEGFDQPCRPWWRYLHSFRYRPMVHRFAKYFAPRRMQRDVSRIQHQLVRTGQAAWAGQNIYVPNYVDESDLQKVIGRVLELLK